MRTRGEQIAALAAAIYVGAYKAEHAVKEAETYILEAERRAEQRVREEIARDSERLDWIGRHFKTSTSYMSGDFVFSPNNKVHVLKGRNFREAIDAAREVG